MLSVALWFKRYLVCDSASPLHLLSSSIVGYCGLSSSYSVGRRKRTETWVRSQCSTDLARSQPSKSHLHKKHSWKARCNFLWDLRNTVGSRSVSGPCKSWKGTSDISFLQSIPLLIDRPESSLANISCSLWHVTQTMCFSVWLTDRTEISRCLLVKGHNI